MIDKAKACEIIFHKVSSSCKELNNMLAINVKYMTEVVHDCIKTKIVQVLLQV